MLSASGCVLQMWDEGPRRAENRFPSEIAGYCTETRNISTRDVLLL